MGLFGRTRQYGLVSSSGGNSYLGGDVPADFSVPENSCPGSFQYLGHLSKRDPAFAWLPFDVNLICPIYMNFDKLWLDYSSPNAPSVLNGEEIDSLDTAYDDLKLKSVVVFERVNIEARQPGLEIRDRLGLAGVPRWLQDEDTPSCPVSGEPMRFLCQLEYRFESEIKVSRTNVVPADEHYRQYFEVMNFWGDGDLYVFFSPSSRVACYFIQKT